MCLIGTKLHRLFGYVTAASAESTIAYLCNRFGQSCLTSRETETSLTSMLAQCIEVSLAGCCRPAYAPDLISCNSREIRLRVCTTSEVSQANIYIQSACMYIFA